jgi:hypothetical protein
MPTNKIKTHVKNIHVNIFFGQNSQEGLQNAKEGKNGGPKSSI